MKKSSENASEMIKKEKVTSRAELKILHLELWLEPAQLGLITIKYVSLYFDVKKWFMKPKCPWSKPLEPTQRLSIFEKLVLKKVKIYQSNMEDRKKFAGFFLS